MPIPQEPEIRRVILEFLKDGRLHDFSTQDFLRITAEYFGADLNEISSTDKSILKSRVNSAKNYLKRQKLISNPSLRGHIITKAGRNILDNTTGIIDDDLLKSLAAVPPPLEPEMWQAEREQKSEALSAETGPEIAEEQELVLNEDAEAGAEDYAESEPEAEDMPHELPDDLGMTTSEEETEDTPSEKESEIETDEESAQEPTDEEESHESESDITEEPEHEEQPSQLPDDLDMTHSEDNSEEPYQEPDLKEEPKTEETASQLTDDLDMTDSESESDLETDEESAQEPPEEEEAHEPEADLTEEQEAEETASEFPDDLDMTDSESESESESNIETDKASEQESDLVEEPETEETASQLPDNLDMTDSDSDLDVDEESAQASPDEEKSHEQESDLTEEPETEDTASELPDNLDMTDSDSDLETDRASEQESDLTEEPETEDTASELPDNLDMTDSDSDLEPDSEPEELPEEDTPQYEYTLDEAAEGEEIMPAEDLAPEEELTEYYPDGAVIQSQSIDDVLARHNSELADRLLMRAASISSEMFEALVIDLLSKMGYRAFQNARYTSDESDSGMIQGVILDTQNPTPIYIHAQKLSPGRTVGRADIQDFVEALSDKGGKGIFATTAEFSENASLYARDERIMLIDGAKLSNLMIAHNFCVNVEKVFELKEIDEDSFSDYE
ncbi:MAG: restriction endonuclease [Synergistaceae bacterium]|nr:restriction endonuclease [Synergistaceae bacterium]